MRLSHYILIIICSMLSSHLLSQTTGSKNAALTLPLVTLMDIEPAGSISLDFTAPTEAGTAIINPTANTTKWINYTSAITSGGTSRKITAKLDTLIPGVNIMVQAGSASGAGGGTLGTSSGLVTLSATAATTIISGIGGAFTGNGTNNGHQLSITISPSVYANLSASANNVAVITYTITE